MVIMILIFILMFYVFTINRHRDSQKSYNFIIPLFYINFLIANIYFYLHATDHLNISF